MSGNVTWWFVRIGILLLAGWARIANYQDVLASGEMIPQLDGDSAYHLHRILETSHHFPQVAAFDAWMNWPKGGFCHWADGFDIGGATLVKLFHASSDSGGAVVAGCWPVLLGLIAVWATMDLARMVAPDRGGRVAALAAGIVVAVLPEFVSNSRYGRVDHHVLEALLMVALASWAIRGVPGCRAPAARNRSLRSRALFEIEGAVLSGIGIWSFTGAPMYVGIAASVVLSGVLSSRAQPEFFGSGAAGLQVGAIAGGVLTVPALHQHGHVASFAFPSLLQPTLVGVAAAGLAGACATARIRRNATFVGRWAFLAACCVLLVAALALAVPRMAAELRAAISGWLLHRDRWTSSVLEDQPMFGRLAAGGGDWKTLHGFFGWAGFFFPVAMVVSLWWVGRDNVRRAAAFGGVTITLSAVTLLHSRFSRVLAPFVAVCVGIALQAVIVALSERSALIRKLGPALAAGFLAAVIATDAPLRASLVPPRVMGPDPFQSAALDLRDRRPVTRGNRSGVAVPWTQGHYVEVLGRRPVVVNGFGTFVDANAFWEMEGAFTGDEQNLVSLMDRRDLGYVVAGGLMMNAPAEGGDMRAPFESGGLSEWFMKRVGVSPLVIGGSGVPGMNVKHLEHLMPVFASHQLVAGIAFPLAAVWNYERVAGAKLRGSAAPGERVFAELEFDEQRRRHIWKAWTDAGEDGTWDITVPLPSRYFTPTIRTGSRWVVRAGKQGRAVRIEVPESAVRAGDFIQVGHLDPST